MTDSFNIKGYQANLLVMLKALDAFCRKNAIEYSLCGGSLLGAVRHKGFIPWDDDIDVMMIRPEYERFLTISQKEFIKGYSIINTRINKNYYLPISKMVDDNTCLIESEETKRCPIGVNIDIFPIDGYNSNDGPEIYSKFRKLLYYAKETSACPTLTDLFMDKKFHPSVLINYIRRTILRTFLNSKKLFEKADKLIREVDFAKSEYCKLYTSYQFHGRVFDKTIFDNYTDMQFEDTIVRCILKYDDYLTSLYKDYMKLPPLDKQVCHHEHYLLIMNKQMANENTLDY